MRGKRARRLGRRPVACQAVETLALPLVSLRCRIRRCNRGLAELADDLRSHIITRLAQRIRPREMRLHEFGDQLEAPALGRPRRQVIAEQQHRAEPAELGAHALDLPDRIVGRADDGDLLLERGADEISRVARDSRRRWNDVVRVIVELANAPRGVGHCLLARFARYASSR